LRLTSLQMLAIIFVSWVFTTATAGAQVHIGSWQLVEGLALKGEEGEPPLYAVNGGGPKTGFFSISCRGGHYMLNGVCGIDRRAGNCVQGSGALRFTIDGSTRFELSGSVSFGQEPIPLSANQVSALSRANRSIALDTLGKGSASFSVVGTSQAFATLAAACSAPNWAALNQPQ
jgi:hypothetical protein